jgi:hypothetical protein
MAALALELQRADRQRQLAEYAKNETAMAERLALPAADPLSDAEWELLTPFVNWCAQRGVRHLPCRCEVAATFLSEVAHRGPEYVASMVAAIGRMHTVHASLADPTASSAVTFVLNQSVTPVEPPRSWPKAEKALFVKLSPAIKAIIAKRESDRERELRRAQNDAAEAKKAIEADRAKVEQATALLQALTEAQQFSDIKTMADVSKLAAEDPIRYLQWDALQKRIAELVKTQPKEKTK